MKIYIIIYLIGYAIVMAIALKEIYNTEKISVDTIYLIITTTFLLFLLYPIALLGMAYDEIKERAKSKTND